MKSRLKFKRLAVLLLAVVFVLLAACDSRPTSTGVEGRLAGVYDLEGKNETIEFFEGNKCYLKGGLMSVAGTYTLDGDNLVLSGWGNKGKNTRKVIDENFSEIN